MEVALNSLLEKLRGMAEEAKASKGTVVSGAAISQFKPLSPDAAAAV
jgi:hypothetical protein